VNSLIYVSKRVCRMHAKLQEALTEVIFFLVNQNSLRFKKLLIK